MSEYCCRIEKLQNGYEVEIQDPEVVKNNSLPYDKRKGEYKNPWVSYAFTDIKGVMAFLTKALPKAVSGNDFNSCFDAACASPADD